MNCLQKVLESRFNNEAGPLAFSKDFEELAMKLELYVITQKGKIIQHTCGNGGWRFTVFTNAAEAQHMADRTNSERYGGNQICQVSHYLDVTN